MNKYRGGAHTGFQNDECPKPLENGQNPSREQPLHFGKNVEES